MNGIPFVRPESDPFQVRKPLLLLLLGLSVVYSIVPHHMNSSMITRKGFSKALERSLMYIRKSTGLITLSCGTPDSIGL